MNLVILFVYSFVYLSFDFYLMATAAVAVKKGDNTEHVPKKRGRKSKKELMNIINGISSIEEVVSSVEPSNVVLNTKNKNVDALSSTTPSVTRRGRKPNSSKILDKNINIVGNGGTANYFSSSSSSSLSSNSAAVAPSQIINSFNQYAIQPNNLPSIILHLKCRVKDTLEENDYSFYDIQNSSHALPTTKAGLNEDSDENADENTDTNYDNSILPQSLQYSQILVQTDELPQYTPIMGLEMAANTNILDTAIQSNSHNHNNSRHQSDGKQNNHPLTEMQAHQKLKELNKKVKHLDFILSSNIEMKKSACFWCTEPYLGRSFHIPKTCINDTYHVYGNFCSLECAAAYLIKNADHQSVIMEQYALLHSLYLDYQPNTCNCIKPAPEPRYMLDKYLGNLSIEEYRTLNSSGRHFILLDKPISKMTPEYHEEYSNFKIQEKNIPSASS